MKVTTVWCGLPNTGAQASSGDLRSLVTEKQGKLFIAARVLGNVSQFDFPDRRQALWRQASRLRDDQESG